ncbi:hypothetical protein JDV02_003441 [Purpureocillium takamizusanense]|uniref:Uncharacterized protein n=1 Tax=Purpureocillium takamizusanense TaxID=2060973 RepID=A0A9Q8V9T6_9HYPO|nr:uncharacterized protein JDV02_003441 [Purpureocillium takamizusanense]UNI17061.1 hypothetical protein JDV02_003441 [Purpureocillium takamizusanense]
MSTSSAIGLAAAMPFGLPPTVVAGAVGFLLVAVIYRLLRGNRVIDRYETRHAEEKEEPVPQVVIEPLHDFDWRTVKPQQFRHFKRVYHITMGLQADAASDLIAIDRDYLDRVTHRRHLIQKHGSGVHGSLPGGVAAASELYTFLLVDYLPTRFPTMFELSGDKSRFTNRATGKSWPTAPPEDAATALSILGETVEEDMFLLHETPEGHKCFAFVCCFPSGFDPSAKVGKLLKDIHAPVPSYDKIGASMERFFSKMEVGKSVKRLNWALQTHSELYNCSGNHMTSEEAETAAQDAHVNIDEVGLLNFLTRFASLPSSH